MDRDIIWSLDAVEINGGWNIVLHSEAVVQFDLEFGGTRYSVFTQFVHQRRRGVSCDPLWRVASLL